ILSPSPVASSISSNGSPPVSMARSIASPAALRNCAFLSAVRSMSHTAQCAPLRVAYCALRMRVLLSRPMTFADLVPQLKSALPALRGRLLANEPLAPLTWFRVGGPAQVLFTPADEDDLGYFLSKLPNEIAVYVVGVGSNLIVRDGGMPGVVIRLSPRGFGETD